MNRPHPRCTRSASHRFAAVAALATLVLGSCSTSDDDAASTAADPPADAATLPEGTERLEGRYAHYDVVAYESEDMKTLIISYGFTDLEVVEEELLATESFCFSEHRSDQPITVELSDTATQAIRPPTTAVDVEEAEDGLLRFFRPETPTGIGVLLDDPFNDPLPTDRDDPRLVDDDGDGNPGVTARITVGDELEGEIYLARREIFAYDVAEQADGSLTGVVRDRSEQLVIGASDDVFLTDEEWVQHPDPDKSPIILVPVERSWDCEQLRAERPGIFPPTPEVDW